MAKEGISQELINMTDAQITEAMMELHAKAAGESISSILKTGIEITNTEMRQMTLQEVDYGILEPAIFVKYCLTNHVAGNLTIILRQRDMQAFLNELMGIDDLPDPDFEFDEVAMSAAGELMNQMTHASIAVVAEALGSGMEASGCHLALSDGRLSLAPVVGGAPDTRVTVISYRMKIKDVVETEFIECITADAMESFTQEIQAMRERVRAEAEAEQKAALAAQTAQMAQTAAQTTKDDMRRSGGVRETAQSYQFPSEENSAGSYAARMNSNERSEKAQAMRGNLNLIMDVPLSVSVVIGKTKRRLKDIMNFSNGTVVELDKQADAPVDIIVNGQLIARGEVVVIDDNFGVRVSEIVNTKNIIGNGELI